MMNPPTSTKRLRARKPRRIEIAIPRVCLNINTPDAQGLTPLHYAVLHNNTMMLSMLLYYEADVGCLDPRNFTPFLLALIVFNLQAVILLYNFYDHFCPRYSYLNYMTILDIASPSYALIIKNPKFLKFIFPIWDKLDRYLTDTELRCFWTNYSRECNTSFYILRGNCFFMLDLGLPFYFPRNRNKYKLRDLFRRCEEILIIPRIRLQLIWIWLSSGIEVRFEDVKTAYKLYGYDQEVEALISTTKSPLLMFVLALEETDRSDFIFKNYLSCAFESEAYQRNWMYSKVFDLIHEILNFFTLPWEMKQKLVRTCKRFEYGLWYGIPALMQKVTSLPEIPSLTELSRTQSLKYLKRNFEMTKVEEFIAIVDCLNLQEDAKNVILFRKPLYI